jgi:hypothetical protein
MTKAKTATGIIGIAVGGFKVVPVVEFDEPFLE